MMTRSLLTHLLTYSLTYVLPHSGFKGTNVTRLSLASRKDGFILKPAHTALRLDRSAPRPLGTNTGGEIWAAPAVPARAGGPDPATDARANSLASLIASDGAPEKNSSRWWYTLLATDVPPPTKTPVGCTNRWRRCDWDIILY